MNTPRGQRGFHVLEIVIIVVILLVLGLIAWRFMSSQGSQPAEKSSTTATPESAFVRWSWNGNAWAADGVAPACPDPLSFSTTPTDLSKVMALLYPGQERGGNYKPHGGFRLDGADGNATVRAIMDGYVTSGARYIEQGELQYMFTITNSCGVASRYDHLATLTPAFITLANSLPAAKENDSRTTNFDNPIKINAGDTVATAVGFKSMSNISFDLGVYDYRKPNVAANNAAYLSKHRSELQQAAYALCWLDMFPAGDSAKLRSLPAADAGAGKTSDYCE